MKLRYKLPFFNWLAQLFQKVSGVPPLVLPRATAGRLKEVTAYGGCALNGIPDEYTELEYLESSDIHCNIDLDFKDHCTVYLDCQGMRTSSASQIIIGCGITVPSYFGKFGNSPYYCMSSAQNGLASQSLFVNRNNIVIYFDKGTDAGFDIDGLAYRYAGSGEPDLQDSNFCLFSAPGKSYGSVVRIYSCKIYQNEALIRDLIPSKRNSDNELGMYDRVSQRFFTNSGTGTFIAGNEVTPSPDKPCEIWCNNGALKVLDKSSWTIFTNPTSQVGQGVYISPDGKWYTADDNGAGCAIPLTIGKQYTLVIHKKTVSLGNTLRYGQSPQASPTSAGVQLTDWYRGSITDGQMVSFVAKLQYLAVQFSAVAVEAGMIQEAVEVLETQGGDYTFLEYIEATGTQYIDTGYYAKANTTVKAKLYTNTTGNRNWFGGTGTLGDSKSFSFNSYSTTQVQYIKGDSGWQRVSADNVVGTPFIVEFTPTYIKINGQKICDLTVLNTTDDKTLCLLCRNGSTVHMPGKVYYFEIWEDNNLIQNLIPVLRNSDDAVGMYDAVSGAFFENAGTGVFMAGPVIGSGEVLKLTPGNDTAGVANLLKTGDYVDTQEILTGLINHWLGIFVFDGTENISSQANYAKSDAFNGYINISGWTSLPGGRRFTLCSQLQTMDKAIWSVVGYPNTTIANHASGNPNMQVHFNIANDILRNYGYIYGDQDYGTLSVGVNAIKAWFTDQYNNGTPVIIIYPLATPTTESVTPQPLTVVEGNNTLEIVQASLSGLELAAEYKRH